MIALCFAITISMNPPTLPSLRKVDIWLGDSVRKVQGLTWQQSQRKDELIDIATVEEPCKLVVHFPSGRQFSSWSHTVFLDRKGEKLWYASTVPIAQRVSFEKVLEKVEEIARELKIDDSPRVQAKLKDWKVKKPREDQGSYFVATGAKIEEGIKARFELRYDAKRKGWFLILQFSVPELAGLPAPK